jgi:hypothetical protein
MMTKSAAIYTLVLLLRGVLMFGCAFNAVIWLAIGIWPTALLYAVVAFALCPLWDSK